MLSATPQHDLRIPIPQRPSTRAAVSAEHHAHLAARLTTRDRWIARMLAEHRVLTSTQITQLAFPSRRATNLRLRQLYCWRVINRFQPYIGAGRAPMFYVLDIAGAHALAHEDGIDPTALKFRPEHSIGIAHSLRGKSGGSCPGSIWWREPDSHRTLFSSRDAQHWRRRILPDGCIRVCRVHQVQQRP